MKNAKISGDNYPKLPDHFSRNLLWADDNPVNLDLNRTYFSSLTMCPASINQTESARLLLELERLETMQAFEVCHVCGCFLGGSAGRKHPKSRQKLQSRRKSSGKNCGWNRRLPNTEAMGGKTPLKPNWRFSAPGSTSCTRSFTKRLIGGMTLSTLCPSASSTCCFRRCTTTTPGAPKCPF